MKTVAKMLIAAVFSLTIGVAFASPMLISDLNNKLEAQNNQGPASDFNINITYSNFTIPDNSSLPYEINPNATNPDDSSPKLGASAKPSQRNSTADQEITKIMRDRNATNAEKITSITNIVLRGDLWVNGVPPGAPQNITEWKIDKVFVDIKNNNTLSIGFSVIPANMTAAQIFVENMTK